MPSVKAPDLVRPAHYTRPKYRLTDGPLVAELCELAGFGPDPEQRMLLDDIFAVDKSGQAAAFESAVLAPRQNLKTGLFKQCALGWLFVTDQKLIVWSAHEFGTAQEAFRDMDELCASHPSISARVKAVHRGNGDEAIELLSGARLKFKARTKGGGRGLTGDKVVLDEAYALRAVHMGALLPMLSAVPDPQLVYGSSAPHVDSDVLHEIRRRGIAGSPRMVFAEWMDTKPETCVTDECDHHYTREGCCLDDLERVANANTQFRKRITIGYLESERRALPAEEYARERLGWPDEPQTPELELSVEDWRLLADEDAAPSGELTLSLDVAPGHAAASIVGFGGGVLELIDRRKGSSWLVERVVELKARHEPKAIAYDPLGPIGALVPEFLKAGIELTPVEGKDSVRACGSLIRGTKEKLFRHRGEPEFEAAVAGARLRAVGDGHKLSRKNSTVDISPLVAGTNALWVAGAIDQPDYDLMSSFG